MSNNPQTAGLRPWRAGESGNPHGRRSDKALVQTVLRQTHDGKELGEILLKIARSAKSNRDRIEACRVLLDRVYGKPPERIEIERQESNKFTLADRDAIVAIFDETLEDERAAKVRAAMKVIPLEIEAHPTDDSQPASREKFNLDDLDRARAEVDSKPEQD